MIINNPQYFFEEMRYANEIGDNTLLKCFERLAYYETGKSESMPNGYEYSHRYFGSKVYVSKDYDEHSFYFRWVDEKGKLIMNGGVIFHGRPGTADTSHSVTLERTYGWTIHT